ncbi:MAG: hypothetical protein IBX40_06320 [Methanosarcinales archaeon]|nr:hypothetical protein [Methanosarcinales archaeon]
MINALDPAIKGWANYHRNIVPKETYQRNDSPSMFSRWWEFS